MVDFNNNAKLLNFSGCGKFHTITLVYNCTHMLLFNYLFNVLGSSVRIQKSLIFICTISDFLAFII